MSSGNNTPQTVRGRIPAHVAIIMDGNNRWAKSRGLRGSAGHRAGVEAIREVLRAFRDGGVSIVTLFAFSSENWRRPKAEVTALMRLFASYLDREQQRLNGDGVRIRFVGRRDRFPASLLRRMEHAESLTAANSESVLAIAVDYGGHWDIVNTARQLAARAVAGQLDPQQIDEQLFDQYTALSDLPKPDLCIRTAGEQRLSNFLLWQLAYAELYFSDVLWPDFGRDEVEAALTAFAERERRFGSRKGDAAPAEGTARLAADNRHA